LRAFTHHNLPLATYTILAINPKHKTNASFMFYFSNWLTNTFSFSWVWQPSFIERYYNLSPALGRHQVPNHSCTRMPLTYMYPTIVMCGKHVWAQYKAVTTEIWFVTNIWSIINLNLVNARGKVFKVILFCCSYCGEWLDFIHNDECEIKLIFVN
jgi:hypothetical protein